MLAHSSAAGNVTMYSHFHLQSRRTEFDLCPMFGYPIYSMLDRSPPLRASVAIACMASLTLFSVGTYTAPLFGLLLFVASYGIGWLTYGVNMCDCLKRSVKPLIPHYIRTQGCLRPRDTSCSCNPFRILLPSYCDCRLCSRRHCSNN